MRMVVGLAIAVVSVLAACAGETGERPDDAQPSGPVTGVIVDVEQTSPVEVTSFVLKDGDDRLDFVIDPEHNYGFALSHLRDHLVSADPVTVTFEERDGELVALGIEDA